MARKTRINNEKQKYLDIHGYPRGNPSDKWTVSQIQAWLTDKYRDSIIPRVVDYKTNSDLPDPTMDKLIAKLQKSATGKTHDDGTMYLGLRKNKKDLLKQTRRVRELEQYDRTTEKAFEFRADQYEKAYQSYTATHGNISRDQYDELVNLYGSVHSLLNSFGYGDKYTKGADRAGSDSLTQYIHDQYTAGFTPGQIRWAMQQAKRELGMTGGKRIIVDARTSLDMLNEVMSRMKPKARPIDGALY